LNCIFVHYLIFPCPKTFIAQFYRTKVLIKKRQAAKLHARFIRIQSNAPKLHAAASACKAKRNKAAQQSSATKQRQQSNATGAQPTPVK